MNINKLTTIRYKGKNSYAIECAIESLKNDIKKITGHLLELTDNHNDDQIRIQTRKNSTEESYSIESKKDYLLIQGNDELGTVFGIYYVCEHILGVDPYWFWTDFHFLPKDRIEVPECDYTPPIPKIRFRGWFINGEDCLIGWHNDMKINLDTWKRIFETMLRGGYNMVIPGTGISAEDPQVELASKMGLWITHHHAEPLGAKMLCDAYPDTKAKFPEEIAKFKELYKKAIIINKGRKIVWGVGFRGQGDGPFYSDDPRHNTLKKRGTVISKMIKIQQELIKSLSKGPHYFAHNLYAESAELYRAGVLDLDKDIIRIWGDNGFGAMRMRRRGATPDEHVSSLPVGKDKYNGAYYHINFHDLQISNQIVPLISPDLICEEIDCLLKNGNMAYFIVNVGNIRPHIFNIELISKIMNSSHSDKKQILPDFWDSYCNKHFPSAREKVKDLLNRYYEAPFQYGEYKDDKAGEQVYHHTLRVGIRGVLQGENISEVFGFVPKKLKTHKDCFLWALNKAIKSLPDWQALYYDAKSLKNELSGNQAIFFNDSVFLHINYMYFSCLGYINGLEGLLAFLKKDYKIAFCEFSKSKKHMKKAWEILLSSEHDKWINFYRGEWLTGTRETIRYLRTIQGLCKILGDYFCSSNWLLEVTNLKGKNMKVIAQASADYDKLARAIDKNAVNNDEEDFSVLL